MIELREIKRELASRRIDAIADSTMRDVIHEVKPLNSIEYLSEAFVTPNNENYFDLLEFRLNEHLPYNQPIDLITEKELYNGRVLKLKK